MTTIAGWLVVLLTAAPTWAALDCDAILARCEETPRQCKAGKLKKCLRQGVAACTMVTTTTLPLEAAHCRFCPTASCQSDGVTCEDCRGRWACVTSVPEGLCCPGSTVYPQPPLNCEPGVEGLCADGLLPPQHGCCSSLP